MAVLSGLSFATLACSAGLLAAALQQAVAAGAAVGPASLVPAVAAVVVGGLLWLAARRADRFREGRFGSGVASWQRSGGLSLVKEGAGRA